MASELVRVDWDDGLWLNVPPAAERVGPDLVVTAAVGSDFWRTTAYGFVHDDGHALLRPFATDDAVEVTFELDYDQQFDQAGVLVRASATTWVKAGVEVSDGAVHAGAVVTQNVSDWSVAPVPGWVGSSVTIRVSRRGDALVVRARCDSEPWQLLRVAPWPVDAATTAGPYCCAPTRSGLRVRFTDWATGPSDRELHPDSSAG